MRPWLCGYCGKHHTERHYRHPLYPPRTRLMDGNGIDAPMMDLSTADVVWDQPRTVYISGDVAIVESLDPHAEVEHCRESMRRADAEIAKLCGQLAECHKALAKGDTDAVED